jgi:uncharacterized protein (TIGR02145 family)
MNFLKEATGFTIMVTLLILPACSGALKDQDGNRINIIKIGQQEWMSENLNVSHFRNGDEIPEAKSAEEWARMGFERKPAWCYGQNNTDNDNNQGKLYNWYAVNDPRGLAPKGWHVASDEEWTQFTSFFGSEVLAAMQMRDKSLSFPPAGARGSDGGYIGSGSHGYWWSASEISASDAWARLLNYVQCNIYSVNHNKISGFSVRCIRN